MSLLDAKIVDDLVAAARAVMHRAHAPYSGFKVGAAVWAGADISAGCNVENASYGLTICAERNAVAAAVAKGHRNIHAVVIHTDTDKPTPPCGACRQVLREFGPDMRVVLSCKTGRREFSLSELLPHGFELDSSR